MFRKYYFLFILTALSFGLKAQQPVLTVDGPDSNKVKLGGLTLDVKIAGNIATTTMTMKFCNSAPRVLEGELTFPMPEGVSISRFALDINGHMREAVPVEKEKGQIVFENIERRNVDPGLLEKTEGNSFRTRIYPIPANGCRTVIIAYEQELHQDTKHSLLYSLPMAFKYPIKDFNASFNVFSSQMPEVGSDCSSGLHFNMSNNVFQAIVQRNDFKPNGSFQLMMPVLENQAGAMMQQADGQYYFMINTYPTAKVQEKKMPSSLSIVWDVSLSGRLRNHQKEFDLLNRYLKQVGNAEVNLFTLGLQLSPAGRFNVSGGNWAELKQVIEQFNYDGATNLSAFKTNLPGGECLFFTDGLNTWGKMQEPGFASAPVYPVAAAASADYELLQMLAAKTGGVFINLNETLPEEAVTRLTQLPLQLINVRTAGTVSEVYPSIAMPVQGNCAVTGISTTPQTEVILEFGYGKTVAFSQTVTLDFSKMQVQQIPLDKIWAQKKIAQLNMQYEAFKPLITSIGKKYGIVTRNTSLIVLDDVADYVKYEIEPPAELKAEYTKLVNEQKDAEKKIKDKSIEDALKVYADVSNWWDRDFKPVKKVPTNVILGDTVATPGMIVGRITDAKDGSPLAGVSVTVKNERRGVATDNDGRFRIQRSSSGNTALVISYVGYVSATVNIPRGNNSMNISLNQSVQQLEESVVVVGYATRRRRDEAASVTTISADQLRNVPAVTVDRALQGRTAGLTVQSSGTGNNRALQQRARRSGAKKAKRGEELAVTETLGAASFSTSVSYESSGVYADSARVSTTAVPFLRIADDADADGMGEVSLIDFNPDRIYLKQMDSLKGMKDYEKYLTLRKQYDQVPMFYFDMANYFLQKGDTATGIKILSGIADLGIEDHELFKTLGYQLKKLGMYDEEVSVYKKVLDWRPQEPQSYRDYGLALADAGKYQQALDTMYTALLKNYNNEITALYPGIEEIILTEINNILAMHGNKVDQSKISKDAVKNMEVDVRVVLNWNMNDTDIDLWVIDPNNEKCFYSHTLTEAGGRISKDFTRGYGPEQFMVKKALKGQYKVMLHYYGDRQQKIAGATTVMAEIYTNYGRPNQQKKLVTLQMEKGANAAGIPVAEFTVE